MTHGSLFSGIGGFELGAQMSGIPTLWNCEIKTFNRLRLKQHFSQSKQYDDIRTLTKPEPVSIISGGFPCQDLSVANSRNNKGLSGERSGLWSEMFRIVDECRPAYVLIENSPELLKKGFEKVLYPLSRIGYDAEWQCLFNSQFGFNHLRKRLYVIAYSKPIGCKNNFKTGGIFQKIHVEKPSGQDSISMPVKRYDSRSDYESVRMDARFPFELDKDRIGACGNAVNAKVAHYLFECIKQHAKLTTP